MLPNCPKCKSEYTYEDGSLLICPECGHEWTAASQTAEEEASIIRDASFSNLLVPRPIVIVING